MYNIKSLLKLYFFNKKWRKKNQHNTTRAGLIFPIEKVDVGKNSYGEINAQYYGNPEEKLTIGNYVSIANNVFFCMGGEHKIHSLMTFPVAEKILMTEKTNTKGPIVIEDDVWIGHGSIILSGVRIGRGAIVAAGSVICKDVPPYAIVTTNRIIKYRFSEEICAKLKNIDFNNIDVKDIYKYRELFVDEVSVENIDNIIAGLTKIKDGF